jgi:hypothetical protein
VAMHLFAPRQGSCAATYHFYNIAQEIKKLKHFNNAGISMANGAFTLNDISGF